MATHFEGVLRGFMEHLKARNYAAASQVGYGEALRGFFGYLTAQGVTDIRRVGKPILKDYHLFITEVPGSSGKRYSWGSISVKVRAVKRLFEWLEETDKILVNPSEGWREGRRPYRLPRRVLSNEEAERILDGVDMRRPQGLRDRAVLEVFYSTGIRLGEMVALRLSDCDLQGGLLRVNEGKGAKDRVVPLGETAGRFVREYLAKVRAKWAKGEDETALWLGPDGKPISKESISLGVRRWSKAAGVQGVTPHVFRHSFATQLVRGGADIAAVSKMMGHSDLRVTQMYAHVAGVDVKKAQETHHPRETAKDREESQAQPPTAGALLYKKHV